MVPTLTCGLSRSNFSFATSIAPSKDLVFGEGGSWRTRESYREPSRDVRSVCLGRGGVAGAALDDLLRDVGRNLVVAVELHGVRGAALRVGAQVRRVAEHLRQRDASRDGQGVAPAVLTLDATAAAAEIADHVAQEVLRGDDLDGE